MSNQDPKFGVLLREIQSIKIDEVVPNRAENFSFAIYFTQAGKIDFEKHKKMLQNPEKFRAVKPKDQSQTENWVFLCKNKKERDEWVALISEWKEKFEVIFEFVQMQRDQKFINDIEEKRNLEEQLLKRLKKEKGDTLNEKRRKLETQKRIEEEKKKKALLKEQEDTKQKLGETEINKDSYYEKF